MRPAPCRVRQALAVGDHGGRADEAEIPADTLIMSELEAGERSVVDRVTMANHGNRGRRYHDHHKSGRDDADRDGIKRICMSECPLSCAPFLALARSVARVICV